MNCPACGNNRSLCTNIPFGHRNRTPWYRCLACNGFYESIVYSRDEEILHIQSTQYGSDQGLVLEQYKNPMYEAVLEIVKRHMAPPAALLDVGCSFGNFLKLAQTAGYTVHGSDLNPKAVRHVHSMGIPTSHASSIRDITSIPEESLDVITCLDCNCYWPDQPAELRSAFKKLKAGGVLVMRVPDKSWMCSLGLVLYRVRQRLGRKVLVEAVNDHRFSMPVKSLTNVIRSQGFEVLYASPKASIHAPTTRWITKLSFAVGMFLWVTTGVFVAPAALIVARRPVS